MLGMSCFVCDFNITVTLRRLVMVLGKSCITIETKEAANIGYNVFFFQHEYSDEGQGLSHIEKGPFTE